MNFPVSAYNFYYNVPINSRSAQSTPIKHPSLPPLFTNVDYPTSSAFSGLGVTNSTISHHSQNYESSNDSSTDGQTSQARKRGRPPGKRNRSKSKDNDGDEKYMIDFDT